jgi:hypothetical protein
LSSPSVGKTYKIHVKPGDAYLVPGDLHFPMQNRGAVKAMWEWVHNRRSAGVWKRFGVIPQGDTIDPIGLSRFPKKARKLWDYGRVKTAVDSALPFLTWAGKTELGCTYLPGNHEAWMMQAIDDVPALSGLAGASFGALTGLDNIEGVEVLEVGDRILLGDKVVIQHGHDLPKTAEGVLRKFPDQFTVYGHYHRAYQVFRTVYDAAGEPGVRGVTCVGMMASNEAVEDYAPFPDMQLAFAIIEFHGRKSNGAPFFRVDLHTIQEEGGQYVVC